MVLNIFINDLNDGIESSVNKFTDGTKLDGEGNMSKGDLNRMGEQESKNWMKFNNFRRRRHLRETWAGWESRRERTG